MTTYTVLPQDDLNLEVTVTDPALAPELQDDSDLDVVVQERENPVVINITPAAVSITSAVTSVNGAVGDVTLDTDDIDEGSSNLYYTESRATINFDSNFLAADTDDLTEGDNNLYYTDARVQTVVDANSAGYITADSTATLTNKSGNISQWTNDAGYITSETDSQTLSFSDPNLTISNGNTVDISAINNIISVNGATGTVVLTSSDVAEGSNKYLTTANVEALDYDSDGGTY